MPLPSQVVVRRHLEPFLGPAAAVFPDPAPTDPGAVEVLRFAPYGPSAPVRTHEGHSPGSADLHEGRHIHTLVTAGMSLHGMTVPGPPEGLDLPPEHRETLARCELMMALPPDWPLPSPDPAAPKPPPWATWPVRVLRDLAKMVRGPGMWLADGHTLPHGDPPTPFEPGVPFVALMVAFPLTLPEELLLFPGGDGRPTRLWAVVPLTAAELQYKLRWGTDDLLERFDAHGVNEVLVRDRPSVVAG